MLRDYEVLIVERTGRGYYSERLKSYVHSTIRKWIHIEGVRSHEQAVSLAKRQGRRVVGVRKFDATRTFLNIEQLPINQEPPIDAVEMDEVVSFKQQKKIDNRWKDKAKVFGVDN